MVLEKLKSIISEELNVPENNIHMETSFVDDLNADSLDVFQIIMAIEDAFDLEIENEDVEKVTTVETVVEYIIEKTDLD